ncbi:hypothetical protein J8K92_06235 [Bacteroides fragilis]|uniref:hypothetical protein n=1 Tax=Bacteroides fragilis TaxID=817 RepID=UPI00202F4CF8|nr:hypothetical protein [Bacteroides fragilis]MCM0298240.1 hypothetical protein [Bacteroides fragilis]
MEFKEIQVEILRGSCNFPSGSIHLSDGSLEKVWHSVACQPDFPEFFTRNIREAGGNERLARVYAILRVDARNTGEPIVSISFYRYKSFPPGFICWYEHCALPGTEFRNYLEELSGKTQESVSCVMEKARYLMLAAILLFLLARFAVVPLFGLSPTIFWLYVPSIMAFFTAIFLSVQRVSS